MDEINAVIKSESLSSYLTVCTNEDEEMVLRDQTKVFTNTKSRLLIHYKDDITHTKNAKKLGAFRNYDQPSGSSTPTLKTFQQRLMLDQFRKEKPSEKLPSQKSSEQTRYNQPFNVEKFRRHSSREVSTSILTQFIRNPSRSGHPKKDFLIGLQGSNRQMAVMRNEYHTEICERSTIDETMRCTNPKEIFSVRDHSFTRQNRVNQNVDTPLKSNNILKADKWEVEKEVLRTGALANVSRNEQPCPQSKPQNKLQNETDSFTLNNDRSIENVDYQSMRQILQSSSSPIVKFDLIQSLVLRLSNQEPDERLTTVQDIVDNDVFGVSEESDNGNTIEDLLWPVNITTPHPLQTSAAKLLNALVSFEIGRDYFNKISMVKLLTWSGKEQIYDSMADNLIGALKKLSLNQFQRRDMLKKGLLQWLISHMEIVEHTASTVHMECMTDLLRVLTSTTEFGSVNVPHFIVVLVRYLIVANEYVQVNVGHVLRTVFLNDAAVAIGNKINLHRIIRNLLKKASNSKLIADLRFIYELFVKHRAGDTSTHTALSADNVSRSIVSENTICCDRQDVNSEIDNQTEQLIHEQNLMQWSEIIAESNSNEGETQQGENEELSTEPNTSFPSELRSYIYQLCVDKGTGEMNHKTPNEDRNDQSGNIESNPGAEVLYSNLNSRLEQSSSLLSSGSQCTSNECKESAIQILKTQSLQSNSAVEMDHENRKLLKNSSSKLHLQKVYENTAPKVLTDYSDLSVIAKDRDARKEILENDSFIDELCEKVLKKLTSKLAANFFCGPNCNTNENNSNCCKNVE